MDLSHAEAGDYALKGRIDLLRRHLTGQQTATAVLTAWCKSRGLGDGEIRTEILESSLSGSRTRQTGYRRVRLFSGAAFVSAAEIRFRCEALSDDMLRELRVTRRPFGAVVAALGPRRITTLAEAPAGGWHSRAGHVLLVHATVLDRHGRPIARVREVCQGTLVM